ncbi:MAG: putative adenine phosphoribosyltransferase [Frankiales bacterium]|nr:putative adenine phosphoribosyltransferase [Frankiales bacterium]
MTNTRPQRPWDVPLKDQGHDPSAMRGVLQGWLMAKVPGARDLRISPVERPSGNGVSNETVLFDATWEGGGRRLVGRLQTDDPLYLDASVERQYQMYASLAAAPGVPVPEMIGFEPDPSVLGTPFFVMERVAGLVPADNPHWTREGWVVDASPAQRETLWRSAVERLVALHAVDTAPFSFLSRPADGRHGLEQDLTYWRRSYRWAAGGQVHPVMEAGEAWLVENLPPAPAPGLSWGDSRPENMIFEDFRCTALLDFESASLAGPSVDLAWWALMDKGSARLSGLGSPQQTVDLYRQLGGDPLHDLRYGLVLCAFRLAAIYLRLAAQLEARGLLTEHNRDLGRHSEKLQQLALLLEVPAPCPVTATLPALDV